MSPTITITAGKGGSPNAAQQVAELRRQTLEFETAETDETYQGNGKKGATQRRSSRNL